MRGIAACNISLALAIFIGATELAAAQNTHMGMAMARTTLLVAQLDGRQVVGGGSSSATGTGTFLLDPSARTLNYNLTYEGLESGGAKSITLRNFGKGGEGEVIKTICGSDAEPCPSAAGATLSGALDSGGRPLENSLIGEFELGARLRGDRRRRRQAGNSRPAWPQHRDGDGHELRGASRAD